MIEVLSKIRDGKPVDVPHYCFVQHKRIPGPFSFSSSCLDLRDLSSVYEGLAENPIWASFKFSVKVDGRMKDGK